MSKGQMQLFTSPLVIHDMNLSSAWGRLLISVVNGTGTEVTPFVLSLNGFNDGGAVFEDPAIRHALDGLLASKGRQTIDDVAFTIFPQRLWEMSRGDRSRPPTRWPPGASRSDGAAAEDHAARDAPRSILASPGRLELPTLRLGGECSIQAELRGRGIGPRRIGGRAAGRKPVDRGQRVRISS